LFAGRRLSLAADDPGLAEMSPRMSTLAPVSSRPVSPRADLDGREMTSRQPLAKKRAAGKNLVFI
jgi:hypothetical protein